MRQKSIHMLLLMVCSIVCLGSSVTSLANSNSKERAFADKITKLDQQYAQPADEGLIVNVKTEIISDQNGRRVQDANDTLQAAAEAPSVDHAKDILEEGGYAVTGENHSSVTVVDTVCNARLMVYGAVPAELQANAVDVIKHDELTILQYKTPDEARDGYLKYKDSACIIPDIPLTVDSLKQEDEYLTYGCELMGMDTVQERMNLAADQLEPITVAVIDSGVTDSEDQIGSRLLSGTTLINDGGGTKDTMGHGSWVAGIIADCTPNNVLIYPIRIFDENGNSNLSLFYSSLEVAANNKADVINCSAGFSFTASEVESMKKTFAVFSKKIDAVNGTLIVTAGNNSSDTSNYVPACFDDTVTVSSINSSKVFSSGFSNYGDAVDYCAPGASIHSIHYKGGVTSKSGTSGSAPHVSAAAAIIKTLHKTYGREKVMQALTSCCEDLGETGKDQKYGYGMPDFDRYDFDAAHCEHIDVTQNGKTICAKCGRETGSQNIQVIWSWSDTFDKASAEVRDNGSVITTVQAAIQISREDPGCITAGEERYTATIDYNGVQYTDTKTKSIEPVGHHYALDHWDWSNSGDQCTAVFTCSTCSSQGTSEAVIKSTVIKSPSCTKIGSSMLTARARFGGKSYSTTKNVTVPASGHSAGTPVTETISATCSAEGKRVTYTVCTVCGDEITREETAIARTAHKIVEDTAVTATCETPGKTRGTHCSVCGTITLAQQTIPAAGHKWGAETITKTPTCAAEGSKTFTCSICKKQKVETLARTAHKEKKLAAVSPMCTQAGKTESVVCSTCGTVIKASEAIPALGHQWDSGRVYRAATEAKEGIYRYTCSRCHNIKDEAIARLAKTETAKSTDTDNQKTKPAETSSAKTDDKSPAAKTPSETQPANSTDLQKDHPEIVSRTEEAPASAQYRVLRLRMKKASKTAITLQWQKISGADGYVIYGSACGGQYQKVADIRKGTTTKWTQKKLKKGKYYKYYCVAYQKSGSTTKVLAVSKSIHVATKGGKYTNSKSIKLKNVKKSKLTLRKGKSFKIKASAVAAVKKLKTKRHRGLTFESTDPKIASVSKSGKITAKEKGKCRIYVYAQNGVYKAITVTVR